MFFLVIQHLILDGRTTDAIDKTKELFPTLLNDKNLLFVLKVRQFIEMVNGTESEIRKTSISSPPPSTSSQTTTTTTNCPSPNNLLATNKNRSNSPSCSTTKNGSCPTTTERSSSPVTKTNTSSRSRSNSPYTSGRITISGAQQHSNGTANSPSRRSSANTTNELPQGKFIQLFSNKLICFFSRNS
jgi:hypothetical protein